MDINTSTIKRILVVRTDRVGDVVLTTPALKALRESFKQAHITLMVAPSTKALVVGNPYVNEVIVDDRKGQHASFFMGFLRLARLIRGKNFDLAIIYHTKRRYNFVCFLAGVPMRLGYRDKNWGFLLTRPIKDFRHLGKQHEVKNCLDVLQALGIKSVDENAIHVSVSPVDLEWARQWMKEHVRESFGLVLIHPGASDTTRRWSKESFAKLIDEINKMYKVKVAIIGDNSLKELAIGINQLLNHPVYDLTGQTSLEQLIALMSLSRLIVSNDSGPAHIAAGVGVPVISIFLRSQPGLNAERWHLKGPYVITLTASKENSIELDKQLRIVKGSFDAITVTQVMDAVSQLWRRYEQSRFNW